MKHIYFIIPAVALLGLIIYTPIYIKRQALTASQTKEEVIEARRAAWLATLPGHEYAGRDGEKEAQEDISRGTLKLKIHGLITPDISHWKEIMRKKFDVNVEIIGGCLVSPHLSKYTDAYNATVKAYVAKQYGSDALERAHEEAWNLLRLDHKRWGLGDS